MGKRLRKKVLPLTDGHEEEVSIKLCNTKADLNKTIQELKKQRSNHIGNKTRYNFQASWKICYNYIFIIVIV